MVGLKSTYKYKKMHKSSIYNKKKIECKNNLNKFGIWGIKVLESGYIREKEILSLRKLLLKRLKRVGSLYMDLDLNMFFTSKPLEVRMGKGVGSVSEWVFVVRKGLLICDVNFKNTSSGYKSYNNNTIESYIKKSLNEACLRVSLRTRVVKYRV